MEDQFPTTVNIAGREHEATCTYFKRDGKIYPLRVKTDIGTFPPLNWIGHLREEARAFEGEGQELYGVES